MIIGMPNSGTSIVAKLYQALGWHYTPDHEVAAKFMESGWLGAVASALHQGRTVEFACRGMRQRLADLRRPAVLKDHRLSWHLSQVEHEFLAVEPDWRLVLLHKPLDRVVESTLRRRGKTDDGWWHRTPQQWWEAAKQSHAQWRGDKVVVRYEEVKVAVAAGDAGAFRKALHAEGAGCGAARVAMDLFDPTRDEPGNPHQGRDGWEF